MGNFEKCFKKHLEHIDDKIVNAEVLKDEHKNIQEMLLIPYKPYFHAGWKMALEWAIDMLRNDPNGFFKILEEIEFSSRA